MLRFQADEGILGSALQNLVKQRRCSERDLKTALADLPDLRVLKLHWLEDQAIPALSAALKGLRPTAQVIPFVTVPLPTEFVVMDVKKYGMPSEIVSSMTRLQEEVALLKALLR